MSEETKIKPTVIVIGAGASADFCPRTKDGKRPEFRSEECIAMPTGEKLVEQMIEFEKEIPELFLYDYLNGILNDDWQSSNVKPLLEEICSNILNIFSKSSNKDYKNVLDWNCVESEMILEFIIDAFPDFCEIELDGTTFKKVYFVAGIIKITNLIKNSLNLHKYTDLGKLIKFYDPPSIDFFLSSIKEGKINLNIEGVENPDADDLLSAGKELIAYYLLKAEDKNTFNAKNKIWYRWFRNEIIRLGKDQEEIKKNILENINIISFNYDRSFEAYLDKKFSKDLADTIKNKIIYPYGSLNSFTDIEYGKLKEIEKLTDNADPKNIQFLSSLFLEGKLAKRVNDPETGIFVIDDERNDNKKDQKNGEKTRYEKEKKKAMVVIDKAKKFYFLGFAFLKENLEFLNLPKNRYETETNKKFYYTNFNNSQKVRMSFNEVFQRKFQGSPLDNEINGRIFSSKGVYDAIEQDFDLNFN